MVWTILKTIEWLTSYLSDKGVREARQSAEHLIAHTLHLSRMDLYLKFERVLTEGELASLKPLIKRRAAREPLQYIIGTQPFRNVEIITEPGALIPRPETEIVVDSALKQIPAGNPVKVLDLCTGSGAIACAIANERPLAEIIATDISPIALKIAEKNIGNYKDRIMLRCGDLFEPVSGEKFNVIVSNPPYISNAEWEGLEPEVRDYEPKEALIAGEDGLDFYRKILNSVALFLESGGYLIMELGDGRSKDIAGLADKCGFRDVAVRRDLNEKERVLVASI